jgi:hypothetical protein
MVAGDSFPQQGECELIESIHTSQLLLAGSTVFGISQVLIKPVSTQLDLVIWIRLL